METGLQNSTKVNGNNMGNVRRESARNFITEKEICEKDN
jgi:hypothetical protein